MDSRGAAQAINAVKNKRQYHISQNALLFDLSLPSKDLKFITVNMLCKNLKLIDLQNNKIEFLPEEISDLIFLEKLKVDNN
jgi:Leucine-rich repeat (LRR) protein